MTDEALERVRREIKALIAARADGGLSEQDQARYEQLLLEEEDLLRLQRPDTYPDG